MTNRPKQTRDMDPALFDAVAKILFSHDPLEITFESNLDEYEPEVETILPGLASCKTTQEVREIVHREMLHWFDAEDVGPEEKYERIAQEIFELLPRI